MSADYEDRMLRVLDYIHENLDGDLSLDALADVAALSRFHWHRVYCAMSGETSAQTVRRVRMHRAACMLVHSDCALSEVTAMCGYDSVQSFSRSFRKCYGLTPAAFRNRGALPAPLLSTSRKDHTMYTVDIRSLPARRLAALPHTGAYDGVGQVFEKISAIFTARGLWPHAQGMAGIYYDDPDAVDAAQLRSHAGVIVDEALALDSPFEDLSLPEGDTAVLRYQGPYSGLKAAYEYLYGAWLPKSDRVPAEAPPFEVYLNNPADTAPDALLTEICLPLARA